MIKRFIASLLPFASMIVVDLFLPLELFAARGLQDHRQVTHSTIADVNALFVVRHAGKYS